MSRERSAFRSQLAVKNQQHNNNNTTCVTVRDITFTRLKEEVRPLIYDETCGGLNNVIHQLRRVRLKQEVMSAVSLRIQCSQQLLGKWFRESGLTAVGFGLCVGGFWR